MLVVSDKDLSDQANRQMIVSQTWFSKQYHPYEEKVKMQNTLTRNTAHLIERTQRKLDGTYPSTDTD